MWLIKHNINGDVSPNRGLRVIRHGGKNSYVEEKRFHNVHIMYIAQSCKISILNGYSPRLSYRVYNQYIFMSCESKLFCILLGKEK